MKNKVIVFLTVIVLIFTGATGVKADTPDIDDCINKTLEYEYKEAAVTDAQSFVNDGLMAVAGISPCEWWVINIKALYPETDFSEYVKAVEKYLDEAENIKPTDYERIALAFYILGEKDDFIREVIKEQTDKMGIMSVIYGLMPAAYGGYDADYIADSLLEFQLPDGSFSVNQKAGDVDVTAMALQAMAPLREKYEEKINKALEYLNNNMTGNGGYKSMGTENSESLAQVIMAKTAFKGAPVTLAGEFVKVGTSAPEFTLVKGDLSNYTLKDGKGKYLILNIFPSLDTGVCATSVRKFNQLAANQPNTVVLAISKDLPFAQGRFCTTEGISNVIPLSDYRYTSDFAEKYGVLMTDGPLAGLLARSVVVVDPEGKVVYTELVPEITQEPDYEAALKAVK